MTAAAVPLWAQILVGCLLLLSAVLTLAAAWGVLRLRDFFERLHPPALALVGSAWCVTLASMLFFSLHDGELQLRAWLIIITLSITVPITTIMLSRAALFRARRKPCGDLLPPPLHPEHSIESAGPGDTRAG